LVWNTRRHRQGVALAERLPQAASVLGPKKGGAKNPAPP
jgi:hypothetical protein